jgi:hypothetical protein
MVRAPGLFALYVTGYSLGRIGEELLRVDPAHRILGLRLNFYVAATLMLAGLAWFIRTQWPRRSCAIRRGEALMIGAGALLLAGCGHDGPNQQAPNATADAACVRSTACGPLAADDAGRRRSQYPSANFASSDISSAFRHING